MALINKTNVLAGNIIRAQDVLNIVNALDGTSVNTTIIATGSFTGSLTGSLLGTASYATKSTPAGTNKSIQYNSSGEFAGVSIFAFDPISTAFSHGEGVLSDGGYSHAQGYFTTASGLASHAEGVSTIANGSGAHAEGYYGVATGLASHAEGYLVEAYGTGSHAEGRRTLAYGDYSHAEGRFTTSSGNYSHAEGSGSISVGEYSHAEGIGTISSGSGQLTVGKYNKQGDSTSLFIVGNGTTNNNRLDAFKVTHSSSIVLSTTHSTAPTWTGVDGEVVPVTIYGSPNSYYLYMWMNGAWKAAEFS